MFPFGGTKWNPSTDISSLAGKVIIVTGGNSGLGKESVLRLAEHDPDLIWLACRNLEKGEEAIADIKKVVPNAKIKLVQLDLASLESVKTAADTILAESDRLDILICNAGVMALPPGLTKDGYEIQFGTNHVGHAFFVRRLTPLLLKTAESSTPPAPDVRVIFLSSKMIEAPLTAGGIQFDKVKTPCDHLGRAGRYGQSKVANVLYAREMAKHYPQFKAVAVHPGVVDTNLPGPLFKAFWPITSILHFASWMVLSSVEEGTKNQLWAATAPDVKSGQMYYPVGIGPKGGKWARDDELAKRLWDWTEDELKARL